MLQTLLLAICFNRYLSNAAVPEPSEYILSFPLDDNPMNITVSPQYEKNYIILLGDWGEPEDSHGNPGKVQTAIAQKMISFYNKQKEDGYNLLFVGLVGDNFYNDGQNCSYYKDRWQNMYGDIATQHVWLSVFGNHDWGLSDDNAVCAWGTQNPYILPSTNIPYAANQINMDKKGCNPFNYYLPDFGYYYTINELNFEWIAVEESATNNCGHPMGKQDWKSCNNSQSIGCQYLGKMQKASENMMKQRANVSLNTNFLISNHYPAVGESLLNDFIKVRTHGNDIIWSTYGHIHQQQCQGKDVNGLCNLIETGGGGGCCSEDTLRGFYVIGFDENKKMIQPYKFNDPLISCQYPCGVSFTEKEIIERNFMHCCYTEHGINCNLYDLSKC